MRYDHYRYLWPPRPQRAVPRPSLPRYGGDWVAQVKMNGTCSVMDISPDRRVTAMTRHGTAHKAWQASPHTAQAFQDLPGGGWYVFVAELLHSKVAGLRDVNYLHDVLVADGEFLGGSTVMERQRLLRSWFRRDGQTETVSHTVLDRHTWLAKSYAGGFETLYDALDRPEHEGIVLKHVQTRLQPCFRQTSNVAGLHKLRRPTKNFGF